MGDSETSDKIKAIAVGYVGSALVGSYFYSESWMAGEVIVVPLVAAFAQPYAMKLSEQLMSKEPFDVTKNATRYVEAYLGQMLILSGLAGSAVTMLAFGTPAKEAVALGLGSAGALGAFVYWSAKSGN